MILLLGIIFFIHDLVQDVINIIYEEVVLYILEYYNGSSFVQLTILSSLRRKLSSVKMIIGVLSSTLLYTIYIYISINIYLSIYITLIELSFLFIYLILMGMLLG